MLIVARATWRRHGHKAQVKVVTRHGEVMTSPVAVFLPALVLFLVPLLLVASGADMSAWTEPSSLLIEPIFLAFFVVGQIVLHVIVE